ncbi:hypothetical protein UA74_03485 [Actinoalloteichus fjordicus]|uniref:Uncharacterized protein n=1 Tax=Actinoalloteichus fjordicus TaxID=1612552 RepID=A0AAC9L7V3_9PSEU|nr:hypothetical protein UA74_03485 [Actinoalloteichus fjordicus]
MSLILLITALPGLVAFVAMTWAAVQRRREKSAPVGSRYGRRSASCARPSRSALAPAHGAQVGEAGTVPSAVPASSLTVGGAS